MSNSNSPSSDHTQKLKGKKQKREKRSILQEENEDGSFGEAAEESQSQEVMNREEAHATVSENGACLSPSHPRWWTLGIRKDDEFFHFVILCFAVGTLLVCYYKYNSK
ncbi:hypothetical protein JD844_012757 [Phrynosoma platyrhinos]|uniref:Transmembrane protein 40 n=1 Tax=Phrynosoma platyrhinos TaxID=52577 RepID=A0ABQ7TLS1_PHRPL|nr:hypothetical protein JD844_012757 [Phrynosoma platyrhinos]